MSCFEDRTLRKTRRSYGTSLPLRYVMDKSNDVILCWEQNGQRLQADHGFPLRIIIPGFIGGRMVKWLKEVKVSDACSDNHYHFKDNRVLPVNVRGLRGFGQSRVDAAATAWILRVGGKPIVHGLTRETPKSRVRAPADSPRRRARQERQPGHEPSTLELRRRRDVDQRRGAPRDKNS